MEIAVDRACGIDVHKETVVACIMGTGIKREIRTYTTMTNDLLRLKAWLKDHRTTHVAMESTGVYWKPVFNILEDAFEVILVNARHVKNVPGRKTDVKDAEWLCKLLRSGLVRGSFIPPKEVRELRDLTRYKRKLIQTITSEKQRVEKILEDANIKLSSIASDTFGASGKKIIQELMLTEFGWIASKMKGTYLWSKYHSLVGRRGKKKALVAVGHKILIICYQILKYKVPYKELGDRYLDERKKDRIAKSYIKRLTGLGYTVTVKEAA